ncbi:hypothetical protein TWF569_005807 [Orbilia oligospora]|uniref:Uncharacterized protein n=1 Tax=Orbilia oligospora TaxID=2813651 RepID=A0A7C8NQL4_ORBOL|nr:hypothetical protein TWF703_006856 [Orbilia oligospora]KAF3148066.1 hypothetical protein TWF569_005807 [Orbilia oligospora]
MVIATAAVVGTVASCPPIVAAFGSSGATAAGAALIPVSGTTIGITSATTAIAAAGEGVLVGVGSIFGGSSAGIAFATLMGPIGAAVVGCNKNDDYSGSGDMYTWDCWKPVVRDISAQRSNGMTLRSLAAHPNVQSVSVNQDGIFTTFDW